MIPTWLAEPVKISSCLDPARNCSVEECDLDARLKSVLVSQGLTSLFPVQSAVLCSSYLKRDLCVAAPTGSGKTLGYALPIVQSLCERKITCLRALILVPGRELAEQVLRVMEPLAQAVSLSVGLAIGQTSLGAEQRRLFAGEHGGDSAVDILVATPGRLMDYIEDGKGKRQLSLQHVEWLVLDEADRLLDDAAHEGSFILPLYSALDPGRFSPSTQVTFRRPCEVPNRSAFWVTPLRKYLFSATLTQNPAKLAELELSNPLYIKAQESSPEQSGGVLTAGKVGEDEAEDDTTYSTPRELSEFLHVCEEDQKPVALLHLLLTNKLTRSICFTRSVASTARLCHLLQSCTPCRIAAFSGELSAEARRQVLASFNRGELDLLVCSDAAARGLDLDQVEAVVNYDIPSHVKTYVHRVGRTARAGRPGVAYNIAAIKEARHFKQMLRVVGKGQAMARLRIPKQVLVDLLPRYEAALLATSQ